MSASVLQFYQISSLLKCPVIGVCLTLGEQRKLVRKGGKTNVASSQPFDVHEILVNLTSDSSYLSRQTNALLRKKYELQAAPLRRLDLVSFMKHWDAVFTTGNYAVALWAAATRPDLPLTLHRHIFGCVHMDMHEALGNKRQHDEQVRLLRQERIFTAEKMKHAKVGLAQVCKELRVLTREHACLLRQKELLQAENQHLKARLTAEKTRPESASHTINAALLLHVEALERSRKEAEQQAEEWAAKYSLAVEEGEIHRSLAMELQQQVLVLMGVSETCAACQDSCSAPCVTCSEPCNECELCPRRILMVGGKSNMEALYRQVVEAKGDAFEYHDGYLGGVNTLKTSLQKADIVLCPVTCNSHRACLLVKNLCKKYKKPVHMMSSFSLSAVSRVLGGAEESPLFVDA